MDEGDYAQHAAEILLSDALSNHQRRVAAGKSGPARRECIDCEELIPEPRREAAPHCTRCIDCQTIFEKER